MAKKTRQQDHDDFGGIGRGGAALILVVLALTHPWQALREVLALARRLGRRALQLAMLPFAFVALKLWARRRDRRPGFEDYLRSRHDE